MLERLERRLKQGWYQFDPRPAERYELCAECGKPGEYCRGMIAIARMTNPPAGTAVCCRQCRHTWGMVHRNSGQTAPPFDSGEAVMMMAEVTQLIEQERRAEVGRCIARHYRRWQERKAREAADKEKEEE